MKILIRLPNWLGDVVMSTAFIKAVREFYPNARIDVIVKKELAQIAFLIQDLHSIHPFSKRDYEGLSGAYRFGKQHRAEKYDIYFNLPSSLSSLVMAWASGAKKRVGFAKEGGFLFLSNAYKKLANVHRVNEYIRLLEQFSGARAKNLQVKLNPHRTASVIANRILINFNSEAESRRMPVDKAKAIINLLTQTFTDATFTFIGAPKEAAFVEQIINGVINQNRIENLAGKTDLIGLVDLMAASAAMVSTDSGPAHLANSLGTPVIALFGAGDENNTAPFNRGNLTVIRYGQLSCEPCIKNTCNLYGVPKCMEKLDGLAIVGALRGYLREA